MENPKQVLENLLADQAAIIQKLEELQAQKEIQEAEHTSPNTSSMYLQPR